MVDATQINELAKLAGEGDYKAFGRLLDLLEHKRVKQVHSLRMKLPSFFDQADINALWDDSFWEAVQNYSDKEGASFLTYFELMLSSRKKNLLDMMNSQKRNPKQNADLSDDTYGESVFCDIADMQEAIADQSADEHLAFKELADEILTALHKFGEQSTRHAKMRDLIVMDCKEFATATEKHEFLELMIGEKCSIDCMRKKVQRAKQRFRDFFQEK